MRFRHLAIVAVAGVLILAAAPAPAQQAADETAIRARLAGYAEARTRRDAAAEALAYTVDGDFRSSAGPFVSGRPGIEQQLTVTNPTYQFELTVTKLRFLTPDVAVVDADVRTGVNGRLNPLLGTYVMVRQGTGWLISAARISTTPPPRPAAAPSAAPAQ